MPMPSSVTKDHHLLTYLFSEKDRQFAYFMYTLEILKYGDDFTTKFMLK